MDDRYSAVKAAAKRTFEINLRHSWKIRLEFKFQRLQTKLLWPTSSSLPVIQESVYDHLTLLVEELAAARDPHRWCNDLAQHLDTMIASLDGEDVRSKSPGSWEHGG